MTQEERQSIAKKLGVLDTINTSEDVKKFFHQLLYDLHFNFHPDDSFCDYINQDTHEPSLDPDEGVFLDSLMERCFEVCNIQGTDIYEIAEDSFREYLETHRNPVK